MTVLTATSCSFGLYHQSVAQNQSMPALNSKQLDQINNQPLVPAVPEPANAYGPKPGQLNRGPAPDPDAITVLGRPLSGPGSEKPINLQPLESGETNILNIPFN
ncbi:MAG: hypothetical protein ACOYJ4_03110 [Polynucleobacter sp.]|jgi:hypothetical protein